MMSTPDRRLEQLRLAVGLVHAVPGAVLDLMTGHGPIVTVGRHPSADLDPCAMRRVLLAGGCPSRPQPVRWIRSAAVRGSLTDEGGGVHRGTDGRCWVGSLLGPGRVAELVDALDVETPDPVGSDPDGVGTDGIEVRITPDRELAVTLVAVGADDPTAVDRVGPTAVSIAASLLAHEVIVQAGRSPAALSRRRVDRRPPPPR
jgi:hypothetical protein